MACRASPGKAGRSGVWAACQTAVSRHASTAGTARDSRSGSRGLRGWGDSGPPGASAQPSRTHTGRPTQSTGPQREGDKATRRSHPLTRPRTDWRGSGGQDAKPLMSHLVRVREGPGAPTADATWQGRPLTMNTAAEPRGGGKGSRWPGRTRRPARTCWGARVREAGSHRKEKPTDPKEARRGKQEAHAAPRSPAAARSAGDDGGGHDALPSKAPGSTGDKAGRSSRQQSHSENGKAGLCARVPTHVRMGAFPAPPSTAGRHAGPRGRGRRRLPGVAGAQAHLAPTTDSRASLEVE